MLKNMSACFEDVSSRLEAPKTVSAALTVISGVSNCSEQPTAVLKVMRCTYMGARCMNLANHQGGKAIQKQGGADFSGAPVSIPLVGRSVK